MLTESQLREIMPNLSAAKLAAFLPHLNKAMSEYGINTMRRAAAFVAQLAHESGEFRWMEEIWGPTAAQRRYEPETTLSKRLGNSAPGDGKRFKGRGPIQLTGRANYQRFGRLLGVDLVADPARAASPEVGFRTAALYWANRGLNELADAENFREITRRINGGFNGLADRQKYFERAKVALAAAFQGPRPAAAPGRGRAPMPRANVPTEPLTRGFEAIRALSTPGTKRPAAKRKTTGKTATKKSAQKPSTRTKTAKKASTAAKRKKTAAGRSRAKTAKSKARRKTTTRKPVRKAARKK